MFVQSGQISQDGLPDDFKIYIEITVRKRISHFISKRKRYFRVRLSKIWIEAPDVSASLSDNFKISNYAILHQIVLKKVLYIHT